MALKKLLLSRVQILLSLCIIDLIKSHLIRGPSMSLGGDFAAVAGKESCKETLWECSPGMGVNEERMQPGWGDPSPFTHGYSPCRAAF